MKHQQSQRLDRDRMNEPLWAISWCKKKLCNTRWPCCPWGGHYSQVQRAPWTKVVYISWETRYCLMRMYSKCIYNRLCVAYGFSRLTNYPKCKAEEKRQSGMLFLEVGHGGCTLIPGTAAMGLSLSLETSGRNSPHLLAHPSLFPTQCLCVQVAVRALAWGM